MSYKQNFKNIDWSVKIDKTAKVVEYIEIQRSSLKSPMIFGDYQAYECPVTGTMIEGRRAHSENLKNTGCRILESGEFEDTKKNGKKNYLDGIDAAVDRAVDEIAAEI